MLARSRSPRLVIASAMALAGLVAVPTSSVAAPAPDSPTDLPSAFPYQPELKEVPADPADASIPRGSIAYHEIAPRLNDWMQESDIISAQVVGQSTNGRDLHMVTITAPETEAQTAQQEQWKDEIKNDAAVAAKDAELLAGYKTPIWFNNNIHGNEWEGTDSSLQYIEYLLENENDRAVRELLKEHRLYFTLTNNPDGRVAGTRATALGFDPNRDFVTNTLPETSIVRDLASSVQPVFFSDIHGYTNVLQVEPTGPPHGENYDYDLFIPHAYASALKIQEDVVAADIPGNTYYDKATNTATSRKTGLIKIPYRDTPAGWDDWPPVFTAQYVAFQGAVASTVELPLARSSNAATHKANGLVNQKVGLEVIESTVEYAVENSEGLLENQIEIFRRGDAGEPLRDIPANPDPANYPGPSQWAELWGADDVTGTTFPRAYVIPTGKAQRSATDAAHLVDYLRSHDVEVGRATQAFTLGGKDYAEGSYVVDMHQPLRGLANALLAAGSDISPRVPAMYDISAWSNGYLWGADVDRIGGTGDAAPAVSTTPVGSADATGVAPDRPGSFLGFTLRGVDTFRGLNALLGKGVKVSLVDDGTAVVGNDEQSHTAAAEVAEEFGIAFRPVDGSSLAGEDVKALERLTVGWTGSAADDLTSLRQMGFADDQLVRVDSASITSGAVDLSGIDVLWLGGALTFTDAQSAGRTAMEAYVSSGKGFVGRGSGAAAFANLWLGAGVTSVAGNGSGNGIVRLDTEEDGVLGPVGTEWGFVSPALSFALAAGTAEVEQRFAANRSPDYAEQGTLLSGHWRSTNPTNGPAYAVGRASVFSAQSATSQAKGLVFGTSPVYRTHPRGHFSEIATGLYWAAPAAQDGLEAPVESTVTVGLTEDEQVFGGDPVTATVKVTTAESVPSRAGTARVLMDGEEVAEVAVNSFGNATAALPADLPVGAREVVAEYDPRPGAGIGSSRSETVTLTVLAAPTETGLELSGTSQVFGTAEPIEAAVTVEGPDGLGTAEGSVELLVDGTTVDEAVLSEGAATIPLPANLAVGQRSVAVTYVPAAGSSLASSSSAAQTVTVTPAPPSKVRSTTTVKLSKNRVTTAQRAKATVTVRAEGVAAPTGTVTIKAKGKTVSTFMMWAPYKGKRTITLPKLARGTYTVTVEYAGNAKVLASSGRTTLTVVKK